MPHNHYSLHKIVDRKIVDQPLNSVTFLIGDDG